MPTSDGSTALAPPGRGGPADEEVGAGSRLAELASDSDVTDHLPKSFRTFKELLRRAMSSDGSEDVSDEQALDEASLRRAIDPELVKWVDRGIVSGRFYSLRHAVEAALEALREDEKHSGR